MLEVGLTAMYDLTGASYSVAATLSEIRAQSEAAERAFGGRFLGAQVIPRRTGIYLR